MHWLHPPRRSLDPVCKIRTGSHRSGYKRATLARRVTNEERIKCCHKLVRRGALDAGCSRCSDRAIQIAIRGRNLMLTLNFLVNQTRTGQCAKVSNKRRRELLLKINLNRVLQSPVDRIVNYHLTSHDLHRLAHAVQVDARRSFEHRKFAQDRSEERCPIPLCL